VVGVAPLNQRSTAAGASPQEPVPSSHSVRRLIEVLAGCIGTRPAQILLLPSYVNYSLFFLALPVAFETALSIIVFSTVHFLVSEKF